MNNIEFAYPWVLVGLIIVPLLWLWHFLRFEKRKTIVNLPTQRFANTVKPTFKLILMHGLFVAKTIAIAALIVAIARPQSSSSWQNVKAEGIDIILAMDISGSMLARDLEPNRLEAAKEVAVNFIEKRVNDRIGLVIYAGEAYTQSPLTTDHSVIKNLMGDLQNGMVEDGTAIGVGLATAVNRLKESEAKSKIVVLLTDGTNNSGDIPPLTAAEIARKFGIKVYTIAVGTNGMAPMPFKQPNGKITYQNQKVTIDEITLKKIAKQTNGQHFRATDNESLEEIYAQIDELEKTEIDVKEFRKRNEQFYPWAMFAAVILLLEFILQKTILKSITN
ncbi:MAG: Ca-activated chloride channel family protein [Salibacteraceae bacterium]|jgi:Ca-activated chloride channel family protein